MHLQVPPRLHNCEDQRQASSWTLQQVLAWGQDVGLSHDVLTALNGNDVDGATLLSLTRDEIRSELAIALWPSRKKLLAAVENLRLDKSGAPSTIPVLRHRRSTSTAQPRRGDWVMMGNAMPSVKRPVSFCRQSHEQSPFTSTRREQQVMSDHVMSRRMQGNMYGVQHVKDSRQTSPDYHRDDDYDGKLRLALRQEEVVRDQIVVRRMQEELRMFAHDEMMAQHLQNEEVAYPAHAADALHAGLPIIDTCIACMDDKVPGFTLACGHKQCVDCMRDNLQAALQDSSLLPLTCCNVPIDMNCALTLLPHDEATRILRHDVEKAASNKMFCPKCGAFINLELLDNSESTDLLCYECDTRLCTACHKEAHDKLTCREYTYHEAMTGADDLFLEHANENGYKQCPQCKQMIERNGGCKYIYCRDCKEEFRYLCGTQCPVSHQCPKCGP